MTDSFSPDLIFDVGAHEGGDSDFYLKLGYRVVAIEANPQLVEELKKRFAEQVRDGQYTVVDRAIGETDAPITFFINKKSSHWGTANPDWSERNKGLGADSEEITVQSIRFQDVIRSHGCPYYLKIDIEGADMLCVEALRQMDCRPKYISIESNKTSWKALLEEFNTLTNLGYTRFKVVDQQTHKNKSFPNIKGQLIEHAFEGGATGPFGELTEGVWLTRQEAIRRYRKIFFFYKTIGDNTLLSKILPHIPWGKRILTHVSWYDTHAMME